MSARIGRPPKSGTPRDKSLNIRLTEEELTRIKRCADLLGKSRTDTLMLGIAKIEESLQK